MRWTVLASLAGLAAQPALAHHSVAAMYDRDKTVEIEGVLSKVNVQNPHTMMEVTVRGTDGKPAVWTLESRGAAGMERMGFQADTLRIGEVVKVKGAPARQGERQLWLNTLEARGGKTFDFSFRR